MRIQAEPNSIGTAVLVVVMIVFGAGVLYTGLSLREPPPTTQLAVASVVP